jgi:hypothetical protein
VLRLSADYLPMLIHGKEGQGASLFSISAMANLCAQGAKCIYICGYQMARDEFEKQLSLGHTPVTYTANSEPEALGRAQTIYLKREDEHLLSKLSRELPDYSERILFLKNCELFSENAVQQALIHKKLVLSGDIQACSGADAIIAHSWQTTVEFSPLHENSFYQEVPKYSAVITSGANSGIVSLDSYGPSR